MTSSPGSTPKAPLIGLLLIYKFRRLDAKGVGYLADGGKVRIDVVVPYRHQLAMGDGVARRFAEVVEGPKPFRSKRLDAVAHLRGGPAGGSVAGEAAAMPHVDDDLIRKRYERLSPAGREFLDGMLRKVEAGDFAFDPREIEAGMRGLPPADHDELAAIFESLSLGLDARMREAKEVSRAAGGVMSVFEVAYAKLWAEGKPIDPEMTLEEAYRVLKE